MTVHILNRMSIKGLELSSLTKDSFLFKWV